MYACLKCNSKCVVAMAALCVAPTVLGTDVYRLTHSTFNFRILVYMMHVYIYIYIYVYYEPVITPLTLVQ